MDLTMQIIKNNKLLILFFILTGMLLGSFSGADAAELIIAHRGAALEAPENTLAAIKKALTYGVDVIEIDVRQTRDGIVVVIHDAWIDRTTDGSGLVGGMDFSTLRAYSAGRWFDPVFAHERVPSLQEVLECVAGETVLLIEIKGSTQTYPDIHRNVYNLIEEYDAGDWVIIQSFNTEVLKDLHELDDSLRLFKLITAKVPGFPLYLDNFIRRGRIEDMQFISGVSIWKGFASGRAIEYFRSLDLCVYVWTVKTPWGVELFFQRGAQGVIISDLALLLEVSEEVLMQVE